MYPKVIVLLCLIISFPAFSYESDFDKLCGYFDMLDKTIANKNMSVSQKAEFIDKRVKKNLEKNSPARQTWEVIIYAVPNERYEMVMSTAHEILKNNWQCDSMKKHLPTTGM